MTMLEVPSAPFVRAQPTGMPGGCAAAADVAPAGVADRSLPVADVEPVAIPLSDLAVGGFATIHAVLPAENAADRELVLRLIEIGFVPGERVRVVAQGRPGRQPIAVRLSATDSGRRTMSGSTFAMRRHEADFIRVVPDRADNAGA